LILLTFKGRRLMHSNRILASFYQQVAILVKNKNRAQLDRMIDVRNAIVGRLQPIIDFEKCPKPIRDKLSVLTDQSAREIEYIESAIRKLPPDLRVVSSNSR
jgi:hypothetical protein